MYEYFNKILSTQQCGFRQGFSTHHCLLSMTEKWRKYLDKYGVKGTLLTDLSRAFDYLLHDILIAKLAAYGFDYVSLMLIQSYLYKFIVTLKVHERALRLVYQDNSLSFSELLE